MKNLFYFFLASLTLAFVSCGKDDDDCNNPGDLDTVIVGEWGVTAIGIPLGTVTFNANGTLTDEDDVLIGGEIGGVMFDQKSYEVKSNTLLELTASDGTNSISTDANITSYTCDEIEGDIQGIDFTMQRK